MRTHHTLIATAALIAALALPSLASEPSSDPPEPPEATTTTTTTLDPQDAAQSAQEAAQSVWEGQQCSKAFGPITSPTALPAHDDGRGCQFALHDYRSATLDLARLSLDDAQQGLDDAHTVFQAAAAALRSAQDDRTTALAAVKASEADLDAAVANLSPTTTTTTTTTTLPPKPTTTTTTTTTTVPEPTRAEEIEAEWSGECRRVTGTDLPPFGEPPRLWHLQGSLTWQSYFGCQDLLFEWLELGGIEWPR